MRIEYDKRGLGVFDVFDTFFSYQVQNMGQHFCLVYSVEIIRYGCNDPRDEGIGTIHLFYSKNCV